MNNKKKHVLEIQTLPFCETCNLIREIGIYKRTIHDHRRTCNRAVPIQSRESGRISAKIKLRFEGRVDINEASWSEGGQGALREHSRQQK